MAYDGYLKFSPEIYGDSTDTGHEKWISLHSFNVGRTQPTARTARSADAPALSEIVVTKHVDSASAKLHDACATGKPFKSAVLEVPSAHMHWLMNDVIISGVTLAGHAQSDELPTETVTLNFGSIEWSYGPAPSQPGPSRQATGLAGIALSMLRRLAP